MGRKKKNEEPLCSDQIIQLYGDGKHKIGATEKLICAMLGIGDNALRDRRKNPYDFRIGEFALLADAFQWSNAEILSVFNRVDK